MQGLALNERKFWELYRKEFGGYGVVTQGTVDGLNFLLKRFLTETRLDNIPQYSYVLATAFHESGKFVEFQGRKVIERFQPVREMKGKPGSEAWAYQSKYWDAGYFGRGFAQTTHKANYLKVGNLVGVGDLFVRQPDLLLEVRWAYEALVAAMVFGIYRADRKGRQDLDRYFPPHNEFASFEQFYAAREIINGDKNITRRGARHTMGHEIASIAQKFQKILIAARTGNETRFIPDAHSGERYVIAQQPVPATGIITSDTNLLSGDAQNADTGGALVPADSNPISPSVPRSQSPDASANQSPTASEILAVQSGETTVIAQKNEPAGDDPSAPARAWLNVEDWKPWVFSKLKWTWSSFSAVNFTQTTGVAFAAMKTGEYWYVPLLIGAAALVLSFIVCALVSLALLAIWYFNRKEINRAKTLEAETKLDPLKPNLQINVEKIQSGMPSIRSFLPQIIRS